MRVKYACTPKLENKYIPARKKKRSKEYMDRPKRVNMEQVRNDVYFITDYGYDL
jgi:hypothetical protein